MGFMAKEHLINLKGKEYLQVAWRLVWLREEHPDWCINTYIVEQDDIHAIFRATIMNSEGVLIASAHGSETKKDFGDFLEKAETKAVGRALAMCGYGTQFTADELDEGERIVDSPLPMNRKPETYTCEHCGCDITDREVNGKVMTAAEIASISKRRHNAVYCCECMKAKKEEQK